MNNCIPTDPQLHDLAKVSHAELLDETPMENETPFESLKRMVVEQWGCVTKSDVDILETHFPDLNICAKMGYGSRFLSRSKNFKIDLENNIKYNLDVHNVDQYVREVFIIATDCDLIRKLFNWPEKHSF